MFATVEPPRTVKTASNLTPEAREAIIESVKSGQGELIHSGGESDIFRVGEMVVKRLHDGNRGYMGMLHGECLQVTASALNNTPRDTLNVHVSPVKCWEERGDNYVVSPYVSGPNLVQLYHYAVSGELNADSDERLKAFVTSHPQFSREDFVRQICQLMKRAAEVERQEIGFTARHNHFLVADVIQSSDPYVFQKVVLVLVDNR